MPPARKIGNDADESDHPSTSRAMSPAAAAAAPPPAKRSKSSLPSTTSSTSRRSSTGGRQARMEEYVDEKELQNALLAVAVETAEDVMREEEEEGRERLEMEDEVISATARVVWEALAEDWATDLLAFSRHAGREVIREEDVRLLMRRNPDLLSSVLEECEGGGEEEGAESGLGSVLKRRSTGGSLLGRPSKSSREEAEETERDISTTSHRQTASTTSSTSLVPETPQGRGPLAHSTPVNGRSVSMLARGAKYTMPSPIVEMEEEEERGEMRAGGTSSSSGRRVNRSIVEELSRTMVEGRRGMEGGGEELTPLVIDLRHPREREEEEERRRRKRERVDRELEEIIVARSQAAMGEQKPGPSTRRYEREGSVDLFERSEEGRGGGGGEKEYDSFDDDIMFDEPAATAAGAAGVASAASGGGGEGEDEEPSNRMSESAVLREMLDGHEDERERTIIVREEERDSFDDDDDEILFIEETKEKTPSPKGDALRQQQPASAPAARSQESVDSFLMDDIIEQPAADAAAPVVQQQQAAATAARSQDSIYSFLLDDVIEEPPPAAAAAAAAQPLQQQQQPAAATAGAGSPNSVDSFMMDDIICEEPPPPAAAAASAAAAAPVVQPAPPTRPGVQQLLQQRPDDYDSFDDDDDFVEAAVPSRGPLSLAPAPSGAKSTVANRWSTVEVAEVVSPAATVKREGNSSTRGVFAEDIFGLNDLPGPSSKATPTVPKSTPAAGPKTTPVQPWVPGARPGPSRGTPAAGARTPAAGSGTKGPSAAFSSFSFFDDAASTSEERKPPVPNRENSDFDNFAPSTKKETPKWRGGGGRGRFPRKVDPNSKVNRLIREQSTPVRLSPRPPSRISEVVGSFEDDDFDVSAFDD